MPVPQASVAEREEVADNEERRSEQCGKPRRQATHSEVDRQPPDEQPLEQVDCGDVDAERHEVARHEPPREALVEPPEGGQPKQDEARQDELHHEAVLERDEARLRRDSQPIRGNVVSLAIRSR